MRHPMNDINQLLFLISEALIFCLLLNYYILSVINMFRMLNLEYKGKMSLSRIPSTRQKINEEML